MLPVTCLGLLPGVLCASCYDASTISTFQYNVLLIKFLWLFILIFIALMHCKKRIVYPTGWIFYNRKYIYIYPAESVLVLLSMIGKISRIREIPETLVLSVWKNHCRIICYYTTNVVNDYACMSWVCSFLKHCQEYKPCPAVNVLWNLWHSGCL